MSLNKEKLVQELERYQKCISFFIKTMEKYDDMIQKMQEKCLTLQNIKKLLENDLIVKHKHVCQVLNKNNDENILLELNKIKEICSKLEKLTEENFISS